MPDRVGDALHRRFAAADWRTVVVDSVAHARPAVVLSFLDDVDLVATHGSVLLLPQLSVCRIEGETLRVAQAVGPDFRQSTPIPDKGVVGRRRPVGRDAHNFADVVVEFLCEFFRSKVVAERDEQIAILGLHHAATNIEATRDGTLLPKDDRCVIEPRRFVFDQTRAQNGDTAAALGGLGVANKNCVRLREIASEQNVHQSGLAHA